MGYKLSENTSQEEIKPSRLCLERSVRKAVGEGLSVLLRGGARAKALRRPLLSWALVLLWNVVLTVSIGLSSHRTGSSGYSVQEDALCTPVSPAFGTVADAQ